MAEKSLYWETNGTGDGTGTGYTDSEIFEMFRGMFARTANLGGVAPDYQNELEVTGSASPVAVNTGAAVVYGIPYKNTSSLNVVIPTPASLTRIDRIVLRADWTAQTVRITRVAGSEGGAAPSLTQTPGTTWDIPLAQVSITTGGVITVTDEREWIGGLGDGDVTGEKIADYAINPRTHISGQNGIVIDPQNGDARGNHAVDLQTQRVGSADVASGQNAVLTGGVSNEAQGNYSVCSGGNSNRANFESAAVGGGFQNDALAIEATIAGGRGNDVANNCTGGAIGGGTENTITGSVINSVIAGGERNTVQANYAAILGGFRGVANKYGQQAHASGRFAADGDAQTSRLVVRNSTANSTPTELFLDGASLRATIPTDTTWAFRILLVARRTDADGESAAYEFVGCIDNNAGTTALVGTVTKTVIAEDTAAWDANVTADNTNDALVITVTGENAKTIRWVATIWTTEVTG